MIRHKRVVKILSILFVLLLYVVGKRYFFPKVERSMEEVSALPAEVRSESVIRIQQKEMGKDQEKITYYIADVQLGDATDLRTAFARNEYGLNIKDTVSGMARDHKAAFAVNGDYYGFRTDGIVIRNGVLYRNEPAHRECLVMYRDGTADVIPERMTDGQTLVEEGAWNVFSFGPVLVEEGEIREGLDNPYKVDLINESIHEKQPRTGIGVLGKNHFLFIAVDGRDEGYSCGMTFQEFAQLFLDLGCELAYNLDGGSSVTMYRSGEILNRPSAGEERRISDMIYVNEGAENKRKNR